MVEFAFHYTLSVFLGIALCVLSDFIPCERNRELCYRISVGITVAILVAWCIPGIARIIN